MKRLSIIAAFGAALTASATAQDMHDHMNMSGSMNPATKAFMQEMQGMHQAMKGMKATNDPNKDFVMMMKPHHEAAVEMAQTYLKYGDDPVLKKMAQDIIAGQKKEIDEMTKWQAEHRK